MTNKILWAMALLLATTTINAQQERNQSLIASALKGWEYEMKAGVNIGGASPLSIPVEIRSIDGFSPKLNGTIEAVATKWMGKDHRWGVAMGLKFEEKGMTTDATVKNYSTEIINEGNRMAGYWTGRVHTKYNSTLLTLPLTANYRLGNAFKLRAGLFVSYRLDGDFSGFVTDGYLREGTPMGEKLSFSDTQVASYGFSTSLNRWLWGGQIGGSWQAFKHFSVTTDLTWGFNNIFEQDFKTVTFNMYPIYLNIGFGYLF